MQSPECLSEYGFWVYKDQTSFAFAPSLLPFSITMSATTKSNSPVAPVTTKPKDWMKAPMPELQSGSEDELDVLDTKAKERRRRKQVKREEKQRREEVERRACKEAEAERQAREQVERDRAEVQRRAAEVAAKQRAMAQEALKKRAREEPEAGPSGDWSDDVR